jgi:hypothetical protein
LLHQLMLNFTNLCKFKTLRLHICITIITGLAVSILYKLYVLTRNFFNQVIFLTEKEMNSCCNLYDWHTAIPLLFQVFILKVDHHSVNRM